MKRTVVIVIEGVLQSYQNEAIIPTGIFLYHGLKTTFTLALVSNRTNTYDAKYWLDANGFTEHSYLFHTLITDPANPAGKRIAQIGRMREVGCSIDLLIEPDPQVAAEVLRNGVTVLNYLHPLYARPEYRPDYNGFKPKAWDELMTEARRQEELRVADLRLMELDR